MALGRLYDQWQTSTFDFLTDQDRKICKALRQYSERNYYGYRETFHEWDQTKLASALVGHPHLYLQKVPGRCFLLHSLHKEWISFQPPQLRIFPQGDP